MTKKDTGEQSPEQLLDDAVLAIVSRHGHCKQQEVDAMALPAELPSMTVAKEQDAIASSIDRLLESGKIVRKSYSGYRGLALPGV